MLDAWCNGGIAVVHIAGSVRIRRIFEVRRYTSRSMDGGCIGTARNPTPARQRTAGKTAVVVTSSTPIQASGCVAGKLSAWANGEDHYRQWLTCIKKHTAPWVRDTCRPSLAEMIYEVMTTGKDR